MAVFALILLALFGTPQTPLDARLGGLPYPFPVHELALTQQGIAVTMAYMDVAPTKAPIGTVLLLHGKNFNAASWDGTIRALTDAGYRVVAPDQIGFGKSSKPRLHYTFDDLADNTAKLLDALGVKAAHVVGHSMGGMLAVRFAHRHAGRTVTLTLQNPIGLEDYGKIVPPVAAEKLVLKDREQTLDAYRKFFARYFVRWKPDYEDWIRLRARTQAGPDADAWAWASALTYQMIFEQPVRAELAQLDVPALLVIGQSDHTIVGRNLVPASALVGYGDFPALGRAAARDLHGAALVEIADVGHVPMFETPDRWQQALLAFLRRHPSSGASLKKDAAAR